MSIRHVVFLMLATISCTGCIQIRETIRLNQDGSGTVQMRVSFVQLGLRWLPGKPVENWVRPNLPDGVRLTSFKNTQSKTKYTDQNGKQHDLVSEVYDVNLSFDRVASLNDIRVGPDVRNAKAASAGGTPGKKLSDAVAAAEDAKPAIGPFQRLTLTEDGDLLHFQRVVQAARSPDAILAGAMRRPGSAAKPEAFDLADSSLVVSIVSPGPVVKHNAHKVDGRTLAWTFNLKKLQERQDRDWVIKFTCRREGAK